MRDKNPIPDRWQSYMLIYIKPYINLIDREMTTKPIAWQMTTNLTPWLLKNLYLESWKPCILTDDNPILLHDNPIPWQMTTRYISWHRRVWPEKWQCCTLTNDKHIPWLMTTLYPERRQHNMLTDVNPISWQVDRSLPYALTNKNPIP